MPRESVDCLIECDIPVSFIRGNGDREVLAFMSGTETEWYRAAPPQWRRPIEWTAQQLETRHARLIAGWPLTYEVNHADLGRVLFCHATPRNDTDCFTRLTPDERVMGLLGDVQAALIVCGHTHMQFDRVVGATQVVNAGSIGMPFGDPGAYWLSLGRRVELRCTVYDGQLAAERIRATAYPDAAAFGERYVLKPPSADEMLEIFSRADAG